MNEYIEALGLLSATDKELGEFWNLSRAEADKKARELSSDSFVDDWIALNRKSA